ncbi:MAG: helix-turn-helix transcriptional regulator [Oscillospiraceae bacterium]
MDITFGEYVRQKRLDRKITLRSFAKQVGISATFISGMENNEKSAPSDEVLKNIAEILQLDKGETDKLYDLAVQTKASNPLPLDIAETVRENAVVRIALRVAKDLDATDEEWEDFMRRLKETRGEGGQ